MDDLPPSERQPYSVADRNGQLRCIGGADNRILSVYRAIMLSLAGNAGRTKAGARKVARIPSEIPSRRQSRRGTAIDADTGSPNVVSVLYPHPEAGGAYPSSLSQTGMSREPSITRQTST